MHTWYAASSRGDGDSNSADMQEKESRHAASNNNAIVSMIFSNDSEPGPEPAEHSSENSAVESTENDSGYIMWRNCLIALGGKLTVI